MRLHRFLNGWYQAPSARAPSAVAPPQKTTRWPVHTALWEKRPAIGASGIFVQLSSVGS